MLIAVLANDEQWKELVEGCNEALFVRLDSVKGEATADAYLILDEHAVSAIKGIEKPVLVNAVTKTLAELEAGNNVLRINGWNGFIQRKTWEVAGNVTSDVRDIFSLLEKQLIEVADKPGLAAARSIAMIINEAYFALGEGVSTKPEIDTAMKLGTNYPYGPFEWAGRIGIKKIYGLLETLHTTGKRYAPAPLLKKEASE